MTVHTRWLAALSALALVTASTYSCAPSEPQSRRATRGATSDIALAAQKVYVAPGDLDPYYMFASGGHSGNVYVYGVPSMRHLATIPRRTRQPATASTTTPRRCSAI